MDNNNQTLLDVYDIRVVEDCKGKREKNLNLLLTNIFIYVRIASHREIAVDLS